MSLLTLASDPWVAAGAGFVVGYVLARVLGGFQSTRDAGRSEDLARRIRALEADLRVAQRNAEEARTDHARQSAELETVLSEVQGLRAKLQTQADEVLKLKADLRQECRKTARLRNELAERAEEMVRTFVELNDTKTELGVAQMGSDFVAAEIESLKAERDRLVRELDQLRRSQDIEDRPAVA